MKSKVKVALLWHNPNSGNLGCSALAISNSHLICSALSENYENIEVTLYGDSLDTTKDGLNVTSEITGIKNNYKKISLRNIPKEILISPIKTLKLFSEFDFVFDISAGDSFSDIYGWKRFATQAYYKILASINSKLIICPQTIGPFKYKASQKIAAYILKKSTYIFSRDSQSAKIANQLINSEGCFETTDVAFSLPYKSTTKKESPHKKVGLNISGLLAKGGYNGKNQFGLKSNYIETTKSIINSITEDGHEVILVPHVISSSMGGFEDDYNISKKISTELGLKISPKFKNPVEAKSYIASLDFFIGARMHATVAALSSETPVVPLAYSIKFSTLFEKINYPHTIDLKSKTAAEISEEILEKLKNIDNIKRQAIRSAQAAKKLNTQYKEKIQEITN